MEFRLLEYFLAITKELHYTRAAEKLGISQPTLSQQMRLLESRLGTKLFQQKGKKIYITEEGKVLKEHANRVFYELDQAVKEINEINGLERGKVMIGCSGTQLLHSSIFSFHKQYPNIELSVVDTTTEDTVENLLNSTFDLGIVFLPVNNDKLESRRLFTSELYLICPKDHELASFPSVPLKELHQQRLFLLQKGYFIRGIIDHYCNEHGVHLNPLVELSDIISLVQMTITNNGVTILPKTYIEQMNDESVKIIPISDPLPQKEVGIVYQKSNFISTAGRAFINHLLHNYYVEEQSL